MNSFRSRPARPECSTSMYCAVASIVDRLEILLHVERQLVETRIHGQHRSESLEHGVSVRRRVHDRLRRKIAGGAAPVVDDPRLSQGLVQFRGDDARERVGPAAGRERYQEPHGPSGIGGLGSERRAAAQCKKAAAKHEDAAISEIHVVRILFTLARMCCSLLCACADRQWGRQEHENRATPCSLAVLLSAASAQAATPVASYPDRPIRVIVPFGPGTGTDILARTLTEDLRATGWNFVVDNSPGGSAQIAAELAAKALPDGYTVFLSTNTPHSANPFLFKKINYDPIKDFAAVCRIIHYGFILVVNPSSKIGTVPELLAFAKARPGQTSSHRQQHRAGERGVFREGSEARLIPVPLQEHAAGHDRPHRRPGPLHVRRHGFEPASRQERSPARDRRHVRPAIEAHAGPTRRGGNRARVRHHAVGRLFRTCGHVESDHFQAEQRDRENDQQAGDQPEAHGTAGWSPCRAEIRTDSTSSCSSNSELGAGKKIRDAEIQPE